MLHPQQDTTITETSHLLSQYDHDISSIGLGLPWTLGPLYSFHQANHSYYTMKKLPHVICIVKHSVLYALSSLYTIPWNNYPKAY